jgi:hypothetical protein
MAALRGRLIREGHLDEFSGHIVRREALVAKSERAAIGAAMTRLEAMPIELWQGPRKIARFEP